MEVQEFKGRKDHANYIKRGIQVENEFIKTVQEHGYSVGDEISLDNIFSEYGSTKRRDRPAAMLATSSTYISAIFAMGNDDEGTSHTAHIIPNAGINGSPDETLTPAKWNVQINFAGGA